MAGDRVQRRHTETDAFVALTDASGCDLGFQRVNAYRAPHRDFCLIGFQHGHTWALFRGYPPIDDDLPGGSSARVLDVFFAGVSRISTWKGVRDFHLRFASPQERETLAERLGDIPEWDTVYLLEAGSIESYVIASRVHWAEYDLGFNDDSPLASDDEQYVAAHPPVRQIRFADARF